MYVCMYVCMYKHLGFKMMWSPFTLRCGGRTGPGALKSERIFSFLLWGWIVGGGEGPPEFFGGFSFRPWGMPWPPWNLLPFMARIRSLAIGTGNFILLILWLTVCVRVWNNDSISPPGYTNATGFNGPFAAAATCAGTGLQPSSSYMRVGWCCMLQTDFWSSGKLTGLMKNLVGPCLMFCASGAILNWMSWTKACGARRLWLYISRPLLGAYKLQRQSGPKGFHPLEDTGLVGLLPAWYAVSHRAQPVHTCAWMQCVSGDQKMPPTDQEPVAAYLTRLSRIVLALRAHGVAISSAELDGLAAKASLLAEEFGQVGSDWHPTKMVRRLRARFTAAALMGRGRRRRRRRPEGDSGHW